MSGNVPVIVTGCQRSGTTLLHLILDSHPQVRGLDETDFDPLRLDHYRGHLDYAPAFACKLPTAAHELGALASLEGLRLLWCLRDPRDVVASMLGLHLPLEGKALSWANHPFGADHEILNCSRVLGTTLAPARFALMRSYQKARRKPPHQRGRAEGLMAAGLCWRLKQELPPLYGRLGLPCHVVRYEDLVNRPEEVLREVMSFVGLPWHDDLLRHHQKHEGTAIGNTDRARPIDPGSVGKWKGVLDETDLRLLGPLLGEAACAAGYDWEGAPGGPGGA